MRLSFPKLVIACGAAALLAPVTASAQVHDLGGRRDDFRGAPSQRYDRGDLDRRRDDDRRDFRRDDFRPQRREDVRIDIGLGQRRDAYETRTEQVWVEPVYRTVCDRVWVAPVVQDVCDRVWVDPVYEVREVVTYEYGRRFVRRERCLVSPGHFEERHRQVVIVEGHWQNVERQELVSAGHWEYRTTQVRIPEPSGWNFSLGYGYGR
jgi:hypothetical protein